MVWYDHTQTKGNPMSNAIALIVPAESPAVVMPFTVGESYEMLSNTVGGLIECVHIAEGIDLWVNEEFLLEDFPMNAFATSLYWLAFPEYVLRNFIYGDVVFTNTDGMGETTGLTIPQFTYLEAGLREFEIPLDLSRIGQNA
jgi:hypothetical protein